MKSASLSTLKKELLNQSPDRLIAICSRLAKFKVENKEMLHYLLFQEYDQEAFIEEAKNEIDSQFENLNRSQHHLAKKTIRKALRTTLRYIKFSGEKTTELSLLIHFCRKLRFSGLTLRYGSVMGNLYMRQIQRIDKVMASLHEDYQLDFASEVAKLK
jgi:hypothetical protein